jgi:hypothetical protein
MISELLETTRVVASGDVGELIFTGPVLGFLGPGAKLKFKALAIKLREFLLGHVRMKARHNPGR